MTVQRVKIFWSGVAWIVDLPQYEMVPGTFLPVIARVISADGPLLSDGQDGRSGLDPGDPEASLLTVDVDVPERLIDPESGMVDIGLIRSLYRGQPQWDIEGRTLNI